MAKFVCVLPQKPIMCKKCKTMYIPEKIKENGYYENCPTCKFCFNGIPQTIPVWKYNLIRWKRGLW